MAINEPLASLAPTKVLRRCASQNFGGLLPRYVFRYFEVFIVKSQFVLLFFMFSGPAFATPISIESFVRISTEETMYPRFNDSGGDTTLNQYSGFVEILVSGTGVGCPCPDGYVDAFYSYDPASNAMGRLINNTLRLGSESIIVPVAGTNFIPNDSRRAEAGSIHVAEIAVAYEGDSFYVPGGLEPLDITDGIAPVYNPDHRYHFVIDLGSYNGLLTLGLGDGGVFDNSTDTYNISLWQVQLNSVPEPNSLALLFSGGVLLFASKILKHNIALKFARFTRPTRVLRRGASQNSGGLARR